MKLEIMLREKDNPTYQVSSDQSLFIEEIIKTLPKSSYPYLPDAWFGYRGMTISSFQDSEISEVGVSCYLVTVVYLDGSKEYLYDEGLQIHNILVNLAVRADDSHR